MSSKESVWSKVKNGTAMKEISGGPFIVLMTNHDEQWLVLATCDPDERQKAFNVAQGWLLCMPQGQVAVAQIVAYDAKYPLNDVNDD